MLEAIIAFFPIKEDHDAIGALESSTESRKYYAKQSIKYKCDICGPISNILKPIDKFKNSNNDNKTNNNNEKDDKNDENVENKNNYNMDNTNNTVDPKIIKIQKLFLLALRKMLILLQIVLRHQIKRENFSSKEILEIHQIILKKYT